MSAAFSCRPFCWTEYAREHREIISEHIDNRVVDIYPEVMQQLLIGCSVRRRLMATLVLG
jgi:hypothetical protein